MGAFARRLADSQYLGGSLVLAYVACLLARSCHGVGETFLLPMCSGQSMSLSVGGSSAALVHCGACYGALASFIGLMVWGALNLRRA